MLETKLQAEFHQQNAYRWYGSHHGFISGEGHLTPSSRALELPITATDKLSTKSLHYELAKNHLNPKIHKMISCSYSTVFVFIKPEK